MLASGEISERLAVNSSAGSSGGGGISVPTAGGVGGDTSGIPNNASGSSVDTRSELDFWKALADTLQVIVGKEEGSSIVVNPQGGVIVVHALPEQVREIAQYLDEIQNTAERQVIIEAKILEITLNDNFQSGINWNLLGLSQQGNQFLVANPSPNTVLNAAGTGLQGMVNLTVTDGGTFNTMINLLEQQGNVQILSSPRVSTVNNQNAVIKVGTDEFFVTSVTSNVTPAGSSNTTSSSVGLTPFFAGITLDVTPQIDERRNIILHIKPSISTVVNQEKTIDLGTGGTLDLPLALSTIRESDSVIRAKSGQIVVIGGLMQNSMSENIRELLRASKIPFVGTLFRNTNQTSAKTSSGYYYSEPLLMRMLIVNNPWNGAIRKNGSSISNLGSWISFW